MREILFKAKMRDSGEWINSGNLIHFNENNEYYIPAANSKCICTHDEKDNIVGWDDVIFYKVDPRTVCQYTGLKDKNGRKIFEGDIVDTLYDVEYVGVSAERVGTSVVVFNRGCYMKRKINGNGLYHFILSDNEAVIGNIFDNPELLEVEE